MTRARDVSRLITTPASAYTAYDEVVVSSASPSSSTPIWVDIATASAPAIKTFSNNKWYGVNLQDLDVITIDYLVVAGGGAGRIGAGGAGGVRSSVNETGGGGALEESVSILPNSLPVAYTVTIGAGGTANTQSSGNNSVFGAITSIGGGYGHVADVGGEGGSGGGGGAAQGDPIRVGGVPTSGQGFSGGACAAAVASTTSNGGGGGGAGAIGSNGVSGLGGAGGNGITTLISGTAVVYGGGGGGGGGTTGGGAAGTGGGGAGSKFTTAGSGTTNTGGGGGGSGYNGAHYGGAGGSGVVIIKFPSTYTLSVGAGLTSTNTTSGGYKTYVFTAGTGTVTFS